MGLTVEESSRLLAALRRMRLIETGETPVLTPLTGGVSSLIVRADTARGTLCLKQALPRLKVAALWEAPVERNRAEVAWLRIAAGIVPGCVPAILGEDVYDNAFAMCWLPQDVYPVWKTQLQAGLVDRSVAQAVGSNLAAIHAATADDGEATRDFANDELFYALRLEPYFVAVARKHPLVAREMHRLVEETARTRRTLVHGDISPKNILAGPAGPVFLDAECAVFGDPAFDLAFCLNHLLLKSVWRPQSSNDFADCFDALAGEYLQAVSWEEPHLLEARACALLAGLLLARVDGKSPVEYITTEAGRERVRSFAIPLLQQPVRSLSDIRNRWSQTA